MKNPSGRHFSACRLLGLAAFATGVTLAATVLTACDAEAGWGAIEDPTGRTSFQVAFRSTPSYQDMAEAQAAFTRMAEIVCDATEGQVRIEQIRFTASPVDKDLAAFWLHAQRAASGGPYDRRGTDLRRLGAHMDVFSGDRLRPDRLAHLFGHHAFGLADQYDDQRRRGSACGIGPGFDAGLLDERNHSIMQGAGGMRCLDGPLAGRDCQRDDECAGSTCDAALASEWSVAANHDLRRGAGGSCPRPAPATRLLVGGILPRSAEPIGEHDTTDFLRARATAAWHGEVEMLGPGGVLPGTRIQLYLVHTAPLVWKFVVGADDGELGGTRGVLRMLRTWTLRFNDDFSLGGVEPASAPLVFAGRDGGPSFEVTVEFGTANEAADKDPGHGYDGLQMTAAGAPVVRVSLDGLAGCAAPWCAEAWNETTGRWEVSEQTLVHGMSDWETLVVNHPFLVAPTDLPRAEAPAVCRTPPEFLSDVMGSDQVLLVLDTSRSMGMRADDLRGEVCANGIDDDDDGEVDESDCADSKMEFQRLAARLFLRLIEDRKLHLGLIAMHTDAEVISEVEELGVARRAALGALLATLGAEGDTATGTALERAQQALQAAGKRSRSRTVVLMTDGATNVGVKPGQEERILDPRSYRVFTVGTGRAADYKTLSAIAARSGGVAYATAEAAGLPAIAAELAARLAGRSLLLERTRFVLARGGRRPGARSATASRDFEFDVEEQAGELVVVLVGRNLRLEDWSLLFELEGPGGVRLDDRAPEVRHERGFAVLRLSGPKPGRWRLRVLPAAGLVQHTEILAWTAHERADFFVDAAPRLASTARPVRIGARVSWVGDIDGDVKIHGRVLRPDGSEVAVVLDRDPFTRDWAVDFDRFAGRGLYEVRLRAEVGEGALPALGEPIFDGPARAPLRVASFVRHATASFYLADGLWPACADDDCDGDGIPNAVEDLCGEDVDGDGIPNRYDADSDNDEIFDVIEGAGDLNRDGIPDFCDPDRKPASMAAVIEAVESAMATACDRDGAGNVEGLRSALAAVRRIVQVMRAHTAMPDEQRSDIVARLERVIEHKKAALVLADVLPDFCGKYRSRLEAALVIEKALRADIDAVLEP